MPNYIWQSFELLLNNSNLQITEKFKSSLKNTIIGCICSLFFGYLRGKKFQ